MTSDRLLLPLEAARMLSLTPRALDHRRRAGEIAFCRVGRLVRYRLSTIQSFIATGEMRMPPSRPRKATVTNIKEVRR